MASMQVPSIAGVSLGGRPGQSVAKPELSYADDVLDLTLKSDEVTEGKMPETASASFAVHSGDEYDGDITIDVDPSDITCDIDNTKLGTQTVTFSYTWKKGSVYEKTLNLAKDVSIIAKPQYSVTSGNNTRIYIGKGKDFLFTVKRNYDDEKTYDLFTKIRVDGTDLDPSYYTVEKGSLKVNVYGSHIKTLKKGNHNFEVVFEDGTTNVTLSIIGQSLASNTTPYMIPLTGIE